jgi:hypothetical protein
VKHRTVKLAEKWRYNYTLSEPWEGASGTHSIADWVDPGLVWTLWRSVSHRIPSWSLYLLREDILCIRAVRTTEVRVLHSYTVIRPMYIRLAVIGGWNDLSETPMKYYKMYVTIPRSLRVCMNRHDCEKSSTTTISARREGEVLQNKCHNGIPVLVCREIINNSVW